MKYAARFLISSLALVLFPILTGCGSRVASPISTPSSPVVAAYVSIAENTVELGADEGYQFAASVTGSESIAVVWSIVNCTSSCGTITAAGYYTAPSQITADKYVEVRASLQADSRRFDSVTVHQIPIEVKISPVSGSLFTGGNLKLEAKVDHDISQMGVAWNLTCPEAYCGVLTDATSSTVTFSAPATVSKILVVTLKATSVRDPGRWKDALVSVTAPSTGSLPEGDYAFLFDGWKFDCGSTGCDDGARLAMAGQFHADGKGLITSGTEDINVESGAFESVQITGKYQVGSDDRGALELTNANGTAKYQLVVDPVKGKGAFIAFQEGNGKGLVFGAGKFEKQDKSAFSMQAVIGPYAFGLFGVNYKTWGAENQCAIGRFEVSPSGDLASGRIELQRGTEMKTVLQSGVYHAPSYVLSGKFSSPSLESGRGTATMNLTSTEGGDTAALYFAYYVISANKILLAPVDSPVPSISGSAPLLSGEARRQVGGPFTSASLAGPSIFSMTATVLDPWLFTTQDAAIGQLTGDGKGNISGVLDATGNSVLEVPGYGVNTNNQFRASYAVDPDGRVMLKKIPTETSESQIAYLFGQNQGYVMDEISGSARFGRIEPQDEGPFNENSVSGPLVVSVGRSTAGDTTFVSGWINFDGLGGVSVLVDSNEWEYTNNELLWHTPTSYINGTYTVEPNGRGTLKFGSKSQVFWVASPSKIVTLWQLTGWWPVLVDFWN